VIDRLALLEATAIVDEALHAAFREAIEELQRRVDGLEARPILTMQLPVTHRRVADGGVGGRKERREAKL
jgi:hypothetical protein